MTIESLKETLKSINEEINITLEDIKSDIERHCQYESPNEVEKRIKEMNQFVAQSRKLKKRIAKTEFPVDGDYRVNARISIRIEFGEYFDKRPTKKELVELVAKTSPTYWADYGDINVESVEFIING
ncbi:MAG: hypothetical protein KA714_30600 [Limnoraphis sp. WC205]|jgi:uncharacterized protein (UPF0305 family)|nr:hypothetical protein [Limnoraphis sp. WC205]